MQSENNMTEKGESKRRKERYVWEAVDYVQRWRDLFENGYIDEGGNMRKPTLKQAAELIGVSKKTLEDYYLILRKVSERIDLMRVLEYKMGYLRQLLKEPYADICPDESAQIEEQKEYQQSEWDNMIIEAGVDSDEYQEEIQEQCYLNNQMNNYYYLEDKYQEEQLETEYDADDFLDLNRDMNNPAVPESD